MYLGDFFPGATVQLPWSTNAKTGASITRSVDGSIVVYKGTDLVETSVGVSSIEDIDGVVGLHLTSIDTSGAFFVPHEDYRVILAGSTVDGEAVNAVLGSFSLLNRSTSLLMKPGIVSSAVAPTSSKVYVDGISEETGAFSHRTLYAAYGANLLRRCGVIATHVLTSGRGELTFVAPMSGVLAVGARIVVM